MRVAFVLRSGGEYRQEHVLRLQGQVRKHLPTAEFLVLSDLAIDGVRVLPLRHFWPGWWSKMELFRPDLSGDLLFMDLDSAAVGDLTSLTEVRQLTMLRDFYRPEGLGSGLMLLPEVDRAQVWARWSARPDAWMRRFRRGGDQAFLETVWLDRAARWQDLLPGQVVSYKVDVREAGLSEGVRFVAFHGRPRPWEVGW